MVVNHRRCMTAMLLLACLLGIPAAADDPYRAWGQGRPEESLPLLLDAAVAADTPAAWGDAGLAAAAAGRRPLAVACLTRSLLLAPTRSDTRQALRALDAQPPRLWTDLLGPLAVLGVGWPGLALGVAGGLLLGIGLVTGRRRGLLLGCGVGCLLLSLPGAFGTWHDGARELAVSRRDCTLLDATGRPLEPVPAGAILRHLDRPVWRGKLLVAVDEDTTGFLAAADLILVQQPDALLACGGEDPSANGSTPPPLE